MPLTDLDIYGAINRNGGMQKHENIEKVAEKILEINNNDIRLTKKYLLEDIIVWLKRLEEKDAYCGNELDFGLERSFIIEYLEGLLKEINK